MLDETATGIRVPADRDGGRLIVSLTRSIVIEGAAAGAIFTARLIAARRM
jgi:hypothetical protein